MSLKKGGDVLNLKEIRKTLNVTPEELAHMINVSRTTFYYKQQGKTQWELIDLVNLYDIMKSISSDDTLTIRSGDDEFDIRITRKTAENAEE